MLTREGLEASYLEHITAARENLDKVRAGSNSFVKGFHIAQALVSAQLATAAATALANNVAPWPPVVVGPVTSGAAIHADACLCTSCLEARS